MSQQESPSMDTPIDCFVSGTLASALWLSRFAGIAPLRFDKKNTGWIVSLSPVWSYYGYVFVTLIICSTIVATSTEFMMDQKYTVHMQSNKSRLVWILQVSLMMITAGMSVYGAPNQMHCMINCLNQVQKINSELNINCWPTSLERKSTCVFILWGIAVVIFTVTDHLITVNNTDDFSVEDENQSIYLTIVCVMYSFYYCCYWILQLREMQFAMITLHVKGTLNSANDSLRSLLHEIEDLELQKKLSKITVCNSRVLKVGKKSKRFNNCVHYTSVDSEKSYAANNIKSASSHHETVHRLALVYASICDVVRDVDRSHGLMVVMMLACLLLHLICTPYYFITNLIKESTWQRSILHSVYVAMEFIWCVFHTFNLVIIIEPCHLTHVEMETTRELVSHLLRHTHSIYDPMAVELELFHKHIVLNDAAYRPLKVTTMSRGLVVSILGSITTYLVVIIQL